LLEKTAFPSVPLEHIKNSPKLACCSFMERAVLRLPFFLSYPSTIGKTERLTKFIEKEALLREWPCFDEL
jgi:hypothetical protein